MDLLTKLAYSIDLSFKVTDSEKYEAQIALKRFNIFLGALSQAKDHLGIMYEPFKKHEFVDPKELKEKRGVLNRYKQTVKKNFSKVKRYGFYCIEKLNLFNSDTEVKELISSFKDGIEKMEKFINDFLEQLDNYESEEFAAQVVKLIDGIEKSSDEVIDLVKDRIIEFINTNILTKNWINSTGDELKTSLKDKIPFLIQLNKEREEALSLQLTEKKPVPILNPFQTPSIHYSTGDFVDLQYKDYND